MHSLIIPSIAFPLIVGSALLTLLLVAIAFRRARDPAERRAVFATGSILLLSSFPSMRTCWSSISIRSFIAGRS